MVADMSEVAEIVVERSVVWDFVHSFVAMVDAAE